MFTTILIAYLILTYVVGFFIFKVASPPTGVYGKLFKRESLIMWAFSPITIPLGLVLAYLMD